MKLDAHLHRFNINSNCPQTDNLALLKKPSTQLLKASVGDIKQYHPDISRNFIEGVGFFQKELEGKIERVKLIPINDCQSVRLTYFEKEKNYGELLDQSKAKTIKQIKSQDMPKGLLAIPNIKVLQAYLKNAYINAKPLINGGIKLFINQRG